jgi:small subunit ribosomal protein S16
MTVRIRLKVLKGKKNYQVIVVRSQRKRDTNQFLDKVGFYNPGTKKSGLNSKVIQEWISKGAQPSQTVKNLIKKHSSSAIPTDPTKTVNKD